MKTVPRWKERFVKSRNDKGGHKYGHEGKERRGQTYLKQQRDAIGKTVHVDAVLDCLPP